MNVKKEKSLIPETPTLLACAGSRTNAMKSCPFDTFGHFLASNLHFLALFQEREEKNYVSYIISHMSHVTCHKITSLKKINT